MRRFNPEKELKKIQHGNKNKIIIGVVALLIILGISSSYALYQVRYSKRIIYTKVAPFSNNDIDLAVLVDGKSEDDFPEKDEGKIYEKIDCGKTNVKAYWDYDKWALVLETSKKAKCTVYFKTGTSSSGEKLDTSGANPPELYQGLIPVKYGENGEVIVADKNSTDWYNYDNKQWANAVLINTDNKNIAIDFSSNNNYGNIVGGASYTNEGLILDGKDDGISIGNGLKDLFKHDNTVQAKIKKSGTSRGAILGNFSTANSFNVNYEITESTNKLQIWWNGSFKDFTVNTGVNSNTYVTLTIIYDSDNGKMIVYQDDKKLSESKNGVFPKTNLDFLNALSGRDNSNPVPINGAIEKLVVYDKMLTESEIQQNLNATAGKVGSGGVVEDQLQLYYDFKASQIVDITPGKILPMNAISQMYVWIPRFKYQLFNALPEYTSSARMINVKFEPETKTTGDVSCVTDNTGKETCTNAINGNWYTHPAFKFGDTELRGIWVGKFETSGTATNLVIKPNLGSLTPGDVYTTFDIIRKIDNEYSTNYNLNSNEIDTHLIKNIEWGAMAYLTQSKYGRCDESGTCTEVSTNVSELTGYSTSSSAWGTENGQKASTTGNVYGIYDTSGNLFEFAMGVLVNSSGAIYYGNSGYGSTNTLPNKRYYDIYSDTPASFKSGHLGDATRESQAWYSDSASFISTSAPWFLRSCDRGYGASTGPFAIYAWPGKGQDNISSRITLTAQDGNE